MNERIKELWNEAAKLEADPSWEGQTRFMEKFAELLIQDCANFVRETYDHEAAESIAWTMEIEYGLHGDYA